jgi:hypothetical protein
VEGELLVSFKQTSDINRLKSVQEDPRFGRWIEFISAVLLALATIGTAWCGYQAARWGGEQTTHYVEAMSAGLRAAHLANQTNQVTTLNVNLFVEWSAAVSQGNQVLADFLTQRFPPELKTAMDAWLATEPLENPQAPASPFAMPQYVLPEGEESDRFAMMADEFFEQASQENENSDQYVLLTVMFASVLFFAGISGKFESQLIDLGMLVFAILLFVVGVVILFTYPIH